MMAWVYLIAAGLFEVGWPVGLKWAQDPRKLMIGAVMAIGCLIVSGVLLYFAQKEVAIGTAYAVWTGIGAAGTFLLGVWVFGDPGSTGRYLGVALIIAGVLTLRLAH